MAATALELDDATWNELRSMDVVWGARDGSNMVPYLQAKLASVADVRQGNHIKSWLWASPLIGQVVAAIPRIQAQEWSKKEFMAPILAQLGAEHGTYKLIRRRIPGQPDQRLEVYVDDGSHAYLYHTENDRSLVLVEHKMHNETLKHAVCPYDKFIPLYLHVLSTNAPKLLTLTKNKETFMEMVVETMINKPVGIYLPNKSFLKMFLADDEQKRRFPASQTQGPPPFPTSTPQPMATSPSAAQPSAPSAAQPSATQPAATGQSQPGSFPPAAATHGTNPFSSPGTNPGGFASAPVAGAAAGFAGAAAAFAAATAPGMGNTAHAAPAAPATPFGKAPGAAGSTTPHPTPVAMAVPSFSVTATPRPVVASYQELVGRVDNLDETRIRLARGYEYQMQTDHQSYEDSRPIRLQLSAMMLSSPTKPFGSPPKDGTATPAPSNAAGQAAGQSTNGAFSGQNTNGNGANLFGAAPNNSSNNNTPFGGNNNNSSSNSSAP